MSSETVGSELFRAAGSFQLAENLLAMLVGVLTTARRESPKETYEALLRGAEKQVAGVISALDELEREVLGLNDEMRSDDTIRELLGLVENAGGHPTEELLGRAQHHETQLSGHLRKVIQLRDKTRAFADGLTDTLEFMLPARPAALRVAAAVSKAVEICELRLEDLEDVHDLLRADAALAGGETETQAELRARLSLS